MAEQNQKDEQAKFKKLGVIFVLLTLLSGIIANIDQIIKSSIWGYILNVISKISGGYIWFAFCVIITLIAIMVLFCIWTGKVNPFPKLYNNYRNNRPIFLAKISCSLVVVFIMNILVLALFFKNAFHSEEAKYLFQEAAKIGPTLISTYASRGKVEYSFHKGKPFNYAKIMLQTYGRTVEESCGWVIFLLKGSDLSKFKKITFLVRGENGGEKIGFKAKDARGRENYLLLEENGYLPDKKIKTIWQKVTIPFIDFGDVNFGLMDNFSIFQRGDFVGSRPQIIYLANFEFAIK